jgi:hypothetical protein
MEKQTARNWYWWLWLSPVVTLLSLAWLATLYPEPTVTPLSVLASSLPHLILLVPALHTKSAFVRWQGRQALILAAARTVVPLAFVLALGPSAHLAWALLILIPLWFFGTLGSQRQAARGLCWLMRRCGREKEQPALRRAD